MSGKRAVVANFTEALDLLGDGHEVIAGIRPLPTADPAGSTFGLLAVCGIEVSLPLGGGIPPSLPDVLVYPAPGPTGEGSPTASLQTVPCQMTALSSPGWVIAR